MTYRPTATDFNTFFRGKIFGNHDIFTQRSYADFIRRNDIDLSRAISLFDERLMGTIVFAQRGKRAWLSLMGVRSDLRGCGYGHQLFGDAVAAVRNAGARSIEFEVAQRNGPAIAMYSRHGFAPVDELVMWVRKRVRSKRAEPLTFRRFSESAVARVAHQAAACWQREPRSVAAARSIALVECEGAYAFIRLRDNYALVLDAGARDDAAALALTAELESRIPYDLTLHNEPASSPLSAAFAQAGWRILDRQHRMVGK